MVLNSMSQERNAARASGQVRMSASPPRLRLTRRELVGGAIAGGFALGLPRASDAGAARLEIVGNELRQGGEAVRLVGVAVGDPFYIREGRPETDFAVIAAAWRANVVRLSLHPGHWRAGSAAALERLGADISAARAAGLFVIVDWHVIGFPGHYIERPDPSWGLRSDIYDPDLDLAIAFWTEMARSFGRDDGVLFELWNEPVVDPKLWISTGQHWPLLKATWMRLLEVIRRHSDAIVLAAGGRWAHDLKGVAHDLIPDDRVAYSWHCYPNEDKYLPDRWTGSLYSASTGCGRSWSPNGASAPTACAIFAARRTISALRSRATCSIASGCTRPPGAGARRRRRRCSKATGPHPPSSAATCAAI